jgi:hypothetical protein
VSYRKSSKFEYKKIVDWKKIDLCKFAENVETSPVMKDTILFINDTYGGFIHKCPYNNIVLHNVKLEATEWIVKNGAIFPNGDMIAKIKAYNNRQKNLLFIKGKFTQRNFKRREAFT